MTREEVVNRPQYHITSIGIAIFNALVPFVYPDTILPENGEPLPYPKPTIYKELADKTGVSIHSIRQMASGEYSGSISKFVKVCVALGIAPVISFQTLTEIDNLTKE